MLLAVKSNLNCIHIPVKSIPGIEQVFVSLKLNGIKLLLGCVYIPPNTHSDLYYQHCEVVENIIINYFFDNILIIGDFNLPGFSLGVNNLINNPSTNIIVNSYINYLGLNQFNNIPNYRNDNILDLIFSDTHLHTIFPGCSLTPLVDSYHPPLEFLYPLNSPNLLKDQPISVIYNFNACNFNDIIRFLANIDIISNLMNLHVDAAISKFYEILNHCFNLFVPKLNINNNKPHNIVWSNSEFKLTRLKKDAHKKYKITNNYSDYLKFSQLRKKCKLLSVHIHANYISKIENNINQNSKFFWKYIKTFKSNKSNIPSSVTFDGIISDNIENTSKLFASYFSSVYSNNITITAKHELPYTNYYQDLNLNSCVISESDILDTFGSLSEAIGAGPDGLPPIFLKSCLPVLMKPLHYLFNLSFSTGVFPYFWKKSYITPTFKSGDKSNVTNYRPISKLSIIPKAFKAIITKKLSNLISKNISVHQHGFLSKHYTNKFINIPKFPY